MPVLLRDFPSGYYYAGANSWASEPSQALDLKTVEGARAVRAREKLQNTEIITIPEAAQCDWISMLEQWQQAEDRSRAA